MEKATHAVTHRDKGWTPERCRWLIHFTCRGGTVFTSSVPPLSKAHVYRGKREQDREWGHTLAERSEGRLFKWLLVGFVTFFSDKSFARWLLLAWNSLLRPRWLRTHSIACLWLLSARTKSTRHAPSCQMLMSLSSHTQTIQVPPFRPHRCDLWVLSLDILWQFRTWCVRTASALCHSLSLELPLDPFLPTHLLHTSLSVFHYLAFVHFIEQTSMVKTPKTFNDKTFGPTINLLYQRLH